MCGVRSQEYQSGNFYSCFISVTVLHEQRYAVSADTIRRTEYEFRSGLVEYTVISRQQTDPPSYSAMSLWPGKINMLHSNQNAAILTLAKSQVATLPSGINVQVWLPEDCVLQ